MALETRLYLRQQQKLVMTLMLQQAIKLLPLTRLELVQRINQELSENPLLEEIDSTEEVVKIGESGEPDEDTGDGEPDAPDWENYLQEDYDYPSFDGDQADETYSPGNVLRSRVSLNDHLFSQLVLATDDELERRIGTFLIGNIDERGYLQCGIDEVVSSLGVDAQGVEKVLGLIQSFDPLGVGARDLKECILLQLRALEKKNRFAEELVERHLESLKDANFLRLARKLKVPQEELLAAVRQIREMDPQPGYGFNPEVTEYIVPDVFVVKVQDEYQVILNEDGVPNLRINSFYRKLLRQHKTSDKAAREFLEQKLKSALWLMKSIEQRRQTLYKVSKSIVKFQRDFLDYGMTHLKPLVLRNVAEDIEMHESTVSRVVTNKYIYTTQGLFELKFFFHSGINSVDGAVMSSVVVKQSLQKMIDQENGERPLTDQEIVERFNGTRIHIARRTVAKYRKELKIPSSGSRKRLFSLDNNSKGETKRRESAESLNGNRISGDGGHGGMDTMP